MSNLNISTFVETSLKLLEKERSAEVEETRSLHEQLPLKELQRQGVCLLKLQISSHRTGLYGRTILQLERHGEQADLPSHKFTPGDIAALSLSQGSTRAVEQLCSGIVTRVSAKALCLAVEESFDQLDLDDTTRYKLTKLANDVTYQRIKKGLSLLNEFDHQRSSQLLNVLFGQCEPGPPFNAVRDGKSLELSFINSNLDNSQQEAVQFALMQREVAIIHGPPGTGKTTTITEVILQAIKQGLKLLVCAPSNIAVDNLVEKLSHHKARMVRIGHPARVLPSIQAYSLDAVLRNSDAGRLVDDVRKDMDNSLKKMKKTNERGERQRMRDDMRHLRKELHSREDKALREVLQGVDVVLCTLTMATRDGPLKHLDKDHFDLVVIDECSQALEAACWIALQQAPRCILAGDHNQLPPTILSHEASKEGLSLTLMERLLKLHGKVIMRMLTTQYRMHENIMTWPSKQLYEGQLTAHQSVAHHLLKDLDGVSDVDVTNSCLTLIDTAGCDLGELQLPGDLSKGNEGEADIVTAHVKKLIEAGLKAENIAVIAPYNLQVELLRLRLNQEHPKLEIKSVDGFQGREKEAVVISLVRSNDKGEVGFLAEDRRINVAITRARRHLAVVCDTDTVNKHDFLKSMVEYMMETGDVISAQDYIEAGALNTNFKRPEYLDDQINRQKGAESVKGESTSSSSNSKQAKQDKSSHKHHNNNNSQTRKTALIAVVTEKKASKPFELESTDNVKYIEKTLAEILLKDKSDEFSFPPSLSAKDRKLVHEMCEDLGLRHESRGEGPSRHIVVSKDTSVGVSTSQTETVAPSENNSSAATEDLSLSSTPGKPSDDGLSVTNIADKDAQTALKCSLCGKQIPKSNFELHQLRCRGDKVPENTDVTRPKSTKKKAKVKKGAASNKPDIPEEDFDALIADAIKDNKSCHFTKCKNSTATLGQNCRFCSRRFCLSHHIAESHGCGDQARAQARGTISREGKLYRGSGVPDKKPDANRRAQLERRLESKLSDMAAKRKIKKKDT